MRKEHYFFFSFLNFLLNSSERETEKLEEQKGTEAGTE